MLKPDFSFQHYVTVSRWKGRGISADEYEAPVILKARVNLSRRHSYTGGTNAVQQIVTSGTVWFSAGTRIGVRDRIEFGGWSFEAVDVQPCYELSGEVNHIEVTIV